MVSIEDKQTGRRLPSTKGKQLEPKWLRRHDTTCKRHDTDVVDIQIGSWVYVSFRGNEMKHFPDYSMVTDILQDTSLESKGLAIQAFVCCNIHEVKARHFWLLEIHNRKSIWIFDSLEGLMPITQEVTKKLWITGFLSGEKCTENQVLTSKALEEIAGKLERKERTSVPIAAWLRKTQQQVVSSKRKKSPYQKKRRFFLARCCLGQVPGGAPFSQRSEQATACTNRMQIRN